MATEIAEATLDAEFTQTTLTGFQDITVGTVNPFTGEVNALSFSNWSDYAGSTWESISWAPTTVPIRWSAPEIDLGGVTYFTLDISAVYTGTISYYVYVSDTGLFAGEETETYISQEGATLSAFLGRYVRVQALVTGSVLSELTVTTNTNTVEFQFTDLDTSTLGGTVSARQLDTSEVALSGITQMIIEPQQPTAYTPELYVSFSQTSQVLLPLVISKGSTPSFVLYGIDGEPRDGVVDITLIALPQMIFTQGQVISNR